jgi:dienelactone hydrolase
MHARMFIAGLVMSLATVSSASAEEKSPALDQMLHRYLLDCARQNFDARRKAIAAIKTPADIAQRQRDLKAFFLTSLGGLPGRTPLNPRVVGTLKRDGYRVEKVIFESRPDYHVTANLYVPSGHPPFPGVLMPCGHSDNGKAYEGYQRACILLAKNGLAVLCYDPIGQGERFQMLDPAGKPVVRGTTEHTMVGIGALLVGRQLATYRIWDGMRALDYLAGRPEVDPARLGCAGNSGGGTLTAYLMALDDRIAVAAPSCFITSVERLFATIGPQDAEQNIAGQVAAGLEHADFVTMRAPRPTLLTVGTRDFFDIQGSWDTFREVKLIFGRLGFGERVDLFESDEEHGFTRPRRVATARWMRRWLLRQDGSIEEPDFPIETDAELQCTQSGQVLTDFKDVSVFDLNRQRANALRSARERTGPGKSKNAFRAEVTTLLGLVDRPVTPVPPRVARDRSASGLSFEVEPGLILPAIDLSVARSPVPSSLTIIKVGVDWNSEQTAASTSAGFAGSAARVLCVDPRGMGKTAPKGEPGKSTSPFGGDWKDAFIALAIGRPLLGQRAADLLAMLEGLHAASGEKDRGGFHVIGTGAAGPVVLHAALLDRHGLIKSITLERSLVSWADVVERGRSRDQMGSVVPGVLSAYDLPDLAARLAPLPLTVEKPVNAIGEPVSQSILEQSYRRCREAYGTTGPLVLRSEYAAEKKE